MEHEITLDGLVKLSKANKSANYLVIKVQADGIVPEIIINPHYNFKKKLAYYQKAYNNDLTLKANPDIRIVAYDFVDNLSKWFDDY